ncbi:CHAT domain-containing tetratricopeptide repeat protein [Terriglobus sp. TAA 43]|uniref:CHAT domain-containing tetratricopeptide repeat protein n=1 Tax=Terriglobus sp. TAA 43 TaxID=278961 RepID=UPI00068A84CC|nr:CHAT domain-containing tetratricopeptide repeat protein [Terriglobus sp. TAA 43]
MKRGGFFCVLASLAFTAGFAHAQTAIPSGGSVQSTLKSGEKRAYQIAAQPGTIVLLQLHLQGGLLFVQSTETPRRILDLGNGGELLYAVTTANDGLAHIELSSAEQSRQASLVLQDVTPAHSALDREHLLAAGIALARADMTRRKMPGAPDGPTALTLYDAAAAEATAAHDVALARWAITQKARYLIYQRSRYVEARALLQQALTLPDASDIAVQALVWKTLEADEYFLGNLQASIEDSEKALELYRKNSDVYWQGIVLGNLVSLYGEAGRADDAVAAGQEALADSEKTEDPAGVVFTLSELGTLYREQGRFEEAFYAFRRAMAWGESIHYAPLIEAEIEKDFGGFYLDLGMNSEAETQLRLCLSHASPDSQVALDARGMLASVLERNGKPQDALREYTSAIAVAQKLELKPEEASLLLRRSATYLHIDQRTAAQNDVADAARLADELKLPALRLDTKLAQAAIYQHTCASCPQTEDLYKQALTLAQDLGEREQEATADAGLALVYEPRHDDEAALNAVAAALNIVEHSRSSLLTRDLAASYFTGRHSWYELAVELSMRLDRRSPNKGFRETAFRYAEHSRARTMLDAIGAQNSMQAADLQPQLRQRILANHVQLEKQKSALLTSTDTKNIATMLRSLYLEEEALNAEASNHPGKLRGDWIASAHDAQQSLLRPGEALISFSYGSSHTYRWLITSSSTTVAPLPAKKVLQQHIAPLLKMMRDHQPALHPGEDAQAYATRLAQWNRSREEALFTVGQLLLPGLPHSIHHLYIVAEGSLLSIPWSSLRIPCGANTCYAVERFATSIEPSVSVAISLSRGQHTTFAKNVLLVADTISTQPQATPQWMRLTALPGTHREADAIARLVPTIYLEQLRGRQATVNNVRSALRTDLAILHVATHTLLVSGHPELSGIALSSGDTHGAMQSVLWLRDIPSLHAPPLVTLSGCTTEGKAPSGEELATLTQAFFYAGAQQVIGSLWDVDDDATATLMTAFYQNLFKNKLSTAEAIRQAQLSMLHNHAAVPDWAAFVVNGVQPAAPHTGGN